MEQKDPPTATGLHVPEGFLDQLLSDLLFGHRFVVQELLKLLNILVAVKGQAMSSCAISACTPCLLVIAFEALWNIVMDYESNIGLVDAHAEGDGGHHHIHLLHEECVLMPGAGGRIETRVIGQGLDSVHL